MQWYATMQLTGIKTIGKMTDYTGKEECVYVYVCACASEHVYFFLSILSKLYTLYFPNTCT